MPPDEFIVELVDAVEDEIEFPEEDPPEELIEEEPVVLDVNDPLILLMGGVGGEPLAQLTGAAVDIELKPKYFELTSGATILTINHSQSSNFLLTFLNSN